MLTHVDPLSNISLLYPVIHSRLSPQAKAIDGRGRPSMAKLMAYISTHSAYNNQSAYI